MAQSRLVAFGGVCGSRKATDHPMMRVPIGKQFDSGLGAAGCIFYPGVRVATVRQITTSSVT
ncbi:hypothetical protein AWC06_08275 [Mycobacterium fragae]|uniref:Uncharacterized protein n=1 Tax=Mycobacterium fragae TaxID=1260918 RepID=A0A1X1V4M3_9MYCO|nr:hypothetical protein AWC06_08275 [Mycobacterium fragae]